MVEGFKTNLFLSDIDLEKLSQWKYKVIDKSITTMLLTPIWEKLVKLVPENVAPNTITLMAFGCVLQAFWLVVWHGEEFPAASAVGAAILTYMYFTLDALDGKHARAIKNGSPMGELFDHGCDNLGCPFQVVTFLKVLGWNDPATTWYLVQATQLIFLSQHISPYNNPDKTIYFGLFSGPGEVLHVVVIVMIMHGMLGQAYIWDLFVKALRLAEAYVIKLDLPPIPQDLLQDGVVNAELFLCKGVQFLYYGVVLGIGIQIIRMMFMNKTVIDEETGKEKVVPAVNNRRSGRALFICLIVRIVPAIIMYYSYRVEIHEVSMVQTISDGVFLSILTSDIIVAKIADRPIHSLVIVMSMASIMSNFCIYASILVYYVTVFGDIANHMNLPMFNTVCNIYCDGIFDVLHRGHQEQFRKAHGCVNAGTRLFVGVINDVDATMYKRKPIMTEEERYAAVASCKYVHAVIRDAPVTHEISKKGEPLSKTEQIIEDNHLHYFAVGEEYKIQKPGKPDYYKLVRDKGMIKYTTRTMGISTSDLITRIAARADEFKPKSD